MSKPTHILVPIADLNKLPILYEKIMSILNSFPKVDLSEEGIQEYLKKNADLWNDEFKYGYAQCAKNLSNTKP